MFIFFPSAFDHITRSRDLSGASYPSTGGTALPLETARRARSFSASTSREERPANTPHNPNSATLYLPFFCSTGWFNPFTIRPHESRRNSCRLPHGPHSCSCRPIRHCATLVPPACQMSRHLPKSMEKFTHRLRANGHLRQVHALHVASANPRQAGLY